MTVIGIALWLIVGYLALLVANRIWVNNFHELIPPFFLGMVILGPFGWAVTCAFAINALADKVEESEEAQKCMRKVLMWKDSDVNGGTSASVEDQ